VRDSHLLRPVLFAWLFVATLTTLPYILATLDPPPGTRFVGFFYFVDDSYNYLSFVQQAEDGAFLFKNKLLLGEQRPTLINLEWWSVGRLSALLGRRPLLAYRLFGLAASFLLLWAIDFWLVRCGLKQSHRLPALLLVSTGGGLGGILFSFAGRPIPGCLDLLTGLFPFVELLGNPHFVAGTALLLFSLGAFLASETSWGVLGASVLGSLLGLVRPYELLLLVGIRSALIWPLRLRSLAALLGLVPVGLYNFWVFFKDPSMRTFSGSYVFPSASDFLWSLGPAALLALVFGGWRRPPGEAGTAVLHLQLWIAGAATLIALHPVGFAMQFLVGLGVPLLSLGALGLSRFPPWVTLAFAAAFSTTAITALSIVLGPNPRWYTPPERMESALELRKSCRPGDVAFTPPDIGLFVGGFTSCSPYVSHPVGPDFAERAAEVAAFLSEGVSPQWRSKLLDEHRVTHVAIPGDPGDVPEQWLGEGTPFRRVATAGRMPSMISLYARESRHFGP
jgi:hypothetical protein